MNSLVASVGGKLWRGISTTASLMSEPMKKKRRVDPILLKLRNERKAKRLERNILKIERAPKQFKPIVELNIPPHVQKEKEIRVRENTDPTAEQEYRKMLRLWNVYRCLQSSNEHRCLRRIMSTQEKALNELKSLSPALWEEAVKKDPTLVPYEDVNYQIKITPANPSYQPPDGHRKDITKEWKM